MINSSITPQYVVDFLNDMLKRDYNATVELLNSRVMCNNLLANHPTIQISDVSSDKGIHASVAANWVGLLGVLNGIFGVKSNGKGCIAAQYNDETEVLEGFIFMPEDDGKKI